MIVKRISGFPCGRPVNPGGHAAVAGEMMIGARYNDTKCWRFWLCRLWLVVVLLLTVGGAAAQTAVEVIPLKYRQGEEVLPVIKPLLGPASSVSVFQNQLVLRATATELAQVRQVLASIDNAPRRLLITVRQSGELQDERRAVDVSGSIGTDRARVAIPGQRLPGSAGVVLGEGDDHLRARVLDTRQNTGDRVSQSVQVLEGRSAFIRTGESRPVRNRQVYRTVINGQVVDRVVEGTDYRDANTGFHVLPRLQGEMVTLELNPQRNRFDDTRRDAMQVQQVATTVSGRLGEWIDLGGVSESRNDEQGRLLGSVTTRRSETRGMQVRVELLP